ncbi:MAG: S1 RNA-binding domain-containing protein [Phycisphaerales bacterium]|nr:MAG: S1 RNA-binding domain-containing protein [Phycisphaerales bacterium]
MDPNPPHAHSAPDAPHNPQRSPEPNPPDAGGAGPTRHTPDERLTDEMERQISEAMADASNDPPPRAAPEPHKPAPAIRGPRVVHAGREHRKGRVVSVGPTDVFVEFGPKELGVVSRALYTDENLPKVDDQLEVVVERFENNEQLFICSPPGAVQKAEWENLEQGQVVEARVTGVNKGGLELEVANHRAFMPASQVDVHRVEDLTVFVGEKMTCKVQRVERTGKGNIVLSRRDVVAEDRAQKAAKARESLKEGDTLEGVVRKVMPFGAFVDIGGVDGLVHVSDMSYDRVADPSKVVKEGDKVAVKVLKLDWENDRHSLGMKQTQDDPFQQATTAVEKGATLSGRVTKLLEFGAFVEIAPGVEGLVHISEMAWKRIGRVDEVVRKDQVVNVKILDIDPDKRRVSLSIKQTTEPPAAPQAGPRGRGRGKGDADDRTPEEILKETPALRRMREEFKKKTASKEKSKESSLKGGGVTGYDGVGLGDLKL